MINKIKSLILKRKFNKLAKRIVIQCTWTLNELEERLNSNSETLTFFDDFMCPCRIKKDDLIDFYNYLKEIVAYGVKPENINLLDNLNKRITGIVNSQLYSYIYELQTL